MSITGVTTPGLGYFLAIPGNPRNKNPENTILKIPNFGDSRLFLIPGYFSYRKPGIIGIRDFRVFEFFRFLGFRIFCIFEIF